MDDLYKPDEEKKIIVRTVLKKHEIKHHVFLTLWFKRDLYKAFCSGNIIGTNKVLSTANCFFSNKKKLTKTLPDVHVVGGAQSALVKKGVGSKQWKKITKVYTQKYFRFPAYNLAVLIVDTPWDITETVNIIPLASLNADFDGVCVAAVVRTITSWTSTKVLNSEKLNVIKMTECQALLQRHCNSFYCTSHIQDNPLATVETGGSGLVCHGTGDPNEVDDRGVLVGVTSLINTQLPTLHSRVALFRKWIDDSASNVEIHQEVILLCLLLGILRNLVFLGYII